MRVANRFHDLIMGSASGFRCARSFVEQVHDDVEPLVFASVEGTISSTKALTGRALYVTAFDANDADSRGMLIRVVPRLLKPDWSPAMKRVKPFL